MMNYIVMTRNTLLKITSLDIPEFRETLVQFMEYVKKSIDERALHKMEYDSRVNERQTQTTEEKIDTSNALDALDASSVIIESNGTESQKQDTSSRSRNDADIRPIYDEEPMAEERVDQNADQCYDTRPLPAKLTDNTTTELSNQLLESENVCLKKTVAQAIQSIFKKRSNEAKVKNDIDVTETINIELEHSVAKLLAENEQLHKEKEHLKQTYKDLFDSIKRTRFVVRQPTAFKSERPKISKERFASQVDVSNDLSKPVTTHYLPKRREFAKPHKWLPASCLGRNVSLMPNHDFLCYKITERSQTRMLRYSLKYRYIVQSYKGRTQSLVAEKTDISENRASRNFDLMIDKWRLLKITLQAPFLNVQKTFDRNRSSLGLHGDDVCSHQFRPRSSLNDF
ncbi:hypothetical protein Tco_0497078 [Tanacetum coccineum]